jgi:hypothetical protein
MTQEFDPLDPHAQEAVHAQDAKTQRLKQEQEISDFNYLMSLPQGRRFMWRLLEKAGVFRSSYSMNGLEMAFKEGNRNLGVMLVAEINEHCPGQYQKMIREQKSGTKRN